MNKKQLTRLFDLIFSDQTKGLTHEIYAELKIPFMADPNALIQLTKVAGKDYSDEEKIRTLISDEVAKNSEYAETLTKILQQLEEANLPEPDTAVAKDADKAEVPVESVDEK